MKKNIITSNSVHIWFLDDDLRKSAQYLTNTALIKTIDGCYAMMVTAILHTIGIRSKKFHDYYFSHDMRQRTMDKFFPDWPFRKLPALRYYTSKVSKWTRQCGEHFTYVKDYFVILLDEHRYRFGRSHKLQKFADWLDESMPERIPFANIRRLCLPWKAIKKKFRNKNIIEGYRRQFMDVFCWDDPVSAYVSSNRDIPDFVVRHYHLDTQSMIT